MIRTISPQDMREMERAFLEGTGYPSILLKEHAAQAVVDALSAYVTGGGRVLFVVGKGATLAEAHANALRDVARIECDNLFHRTDIGHWAFEN